MSTDAKRPEQNAVEPTALERQIDRELRWYPARWRRAHGAALAGTVLDVAEAEGRDVLTSPELRDLRVNGLRQRGLAILPARSRSLASTLALGLGAAFAAIQFLFLEWAPWLDLRAQIEAYGLGGRVEIGFGPFASAAVIVDGLWLLGFAFALLRLRIPMMVAFGLSIVASAIIVLAPGLTSWAFGAPPTSAFALSGFLAASASLGSLGGLRRQPAWTLLVAVVSTVALLVLALQLQMRPLGGGAALLQWLDPWPIGAVLVVAVIVTDLLGRGRVLGDALVLGAGPAWVALVAYSAYYPTSGVAPGAAALGVAVLALLRGTDVRIRLTRDLRRD